jgi:hypothetical protein
MGNDNKTDPPPAGYSVEELLRRDTEPPESEEPTGLVDMTQVIREHEELDGAALYWHNLQALHELAAVRAV